MKTFLQNLVGICICISSYGQNVEDSMLTFKYLPLNESKFLSMYKSERVYHSDTTFTDTGILCQSDTSVSCKIHFKIIDGSWYIAKGEFWKLFFDQKRNRLEDVELQHLDKRLISDRKILVGMDTLYSFICEEIEFNNSSFHTTYYFHPLHGIVIIKGNNGLLKRQDYINPNMKRGLFY